MLRVLQNDYTGGCDSLRVALEHLTAAIAHINDRAQSRMPLHVDAPSGEVEQLQLIVRALSDIVDALAASRVDNEMSAPSAVAGHVSARVTAMPPAAYRH
jgi:hypothetical protein